ncbi:hypothetical protein CEUSTIGMA_g7476.t1 [Chlamydomonas eustigma]|uniref:mRNA decay factor PAT1 domain-containing protein n=1 Tax=Chlamydomonas eustigma TaxID=1157962 RepID=A0A250XAD4_9CHLO|nr:hypothetical protein CEUSTIGMA_g7476.t1 [Chlamydomonas eustigma]|eukprot:GAX80037.1 hypothetical protein CEUSTIGMA_g7476.t1 [Chlamydomonas eustigma]
MNEQNLSKDNFRSAEIVTEPKAFDYTQYSFFGDTAGAEEGLEGLDGALEDGLDAPPEESGLEDGGFYDDGADAAANGEDDLSLATMLMHTARLKDQEHEFLDGPGHSFGGAIGKPSALEATVSHADQGELNTLHVGAVAPKTTNAPRPHPNVMTAADLEATMLSQAQLQQPSSASILHWMEGNHLPGQNSEFSMADSSAESGINEGPFKYSMPSFHDKILHPQEQGEELNSLSEQTGVETDSQISLPHVTHQMQQGQLPPPHTGGPWPQCMPAYRMPEGSMMPIPWPGPPGMPPPPFMQGPPHVGVPPGYPHPYPFPYPQPPNPAVMMGMPPGMQPRPYAPPGPPGPWRIGPQMPYQHPQYGAPVPGYPGGLPPGQPPMEPLPRQAPSQRAHGAPHMHGGRSKRCGTMMSAEEVDYIMHIMYAAVNNGHSYEEDYYFQAYVNSHCHGRNDAYFAPETLRDLSEGVARLDPSVSVKFVPGVEGLGKLAYNNLKTPRVLLDLAGNAGAEVEGVPAAAAKTSSAGQEVLHRRLHQEPMLAARMMIEDCLNLLLDVDDIDRKIKAETTRKATEEWLGMSSPDAKDELLQRRALLLAGITSSFRLPSKAVVEPQEPHSASASTAEAASSVSVEDAVFQKVMMLFKGRSVLGRILKAIPAPLNEKMPTVPNHDPVHLIWATLRNAAFFFGPVKHSDAALEKACAETTSRVASGAILAISSLQENEKLVACLAALTAGLRSAGKSKDLAGPGLPTAVLPLTRVPQVVASAFEFEQQKSDVTWLCDVLIHLLQQGQKQGLQTDAGWKSALHELVDLLVKHLEALLELHAAASAAKNKEAAAFVNALLCKSAVQAVAELSIPEDRVRLRNLMLQFLIS